MPLKTCCICADEFFARWRNTPAVCESCVAHATMCPACWKVTLRTDDPAQLALFSAAELQRRGVWWSVDAMLADHFANRPPRNLELEDHPPWPRRTSKAERQKYPFH